LLSHILHFRASRRPVAASRGSSPNRCPATRSATHTLCPSPDDSASAEVSRAGREHDDASGSAYHTWDGPNALRIKEAAATSEVVHGYSPIAGIDTVAAYRKDGGACHLHCDPRGSAMKITDQNNVVRTGLVNAWGEELAVSGAGYAGASGGGRSARKQGRKGRGSL